MEDDLLRKVTLDFERKGSFSGIPAFKYGVASSTFKTTAEYPEVNVLCWVWFKWFKYKRRFDRGFIKGC